MNEPAARTEETVDVSMFRVSVYQMCGTHSTENRCVLQKYLHVHTKRL